MTEGPTEDVRRRSDRSGRFHYRCAHCGRWFLYRGQLGSAAGPRVSVCGVLLDPPEARCMFCDDFGAMWWPKDKPMPDLAAIQQWMDREEADARG